MAGVRHMFATCKRTPYYVGYEAGVSYTAGQPLLAAGAAPVGGRRKAGRTGQRKIEMLGSKSMVSTCFTRHSANLQTKCFRFWRTIVCVLQGPGEESKQSKDLPVGCSSAAF